MGRERRFVVFGWGDEGFYFRRGGTFMYVHIADDQRKDNCQNKAIEARVALTKIVFLLRSGLSSPILFAMNFNS